MAAIRQFYAGAGVPLHIEGDEGGPAAAWRKHRARVRAWLASVPDSEWSGPTRCELWDVTSLVRHLASGSQFLGYTLHKAAAGEPTSLLQGFDPHATVQAAAAMLGDMTPDGARDSMASMDAAVDAELADMADAGWSAMAEAPPGNLPAYLAVSHFLFDSWVHEYDLMLPCGEQPIVDRAEVRPVVAYLVGLASIACGSDVPLDLRLTDPDLRVGLDVVDGIVTVTVGSTPSGAAVIEGGVLDFVDRTTGRPAGPLQGDDRALGVVDAFASLLAG